MSNQVVETMDHGEWFFHTRTPYFFKAILQRDLRNHNLEIPENFVRRHGGTLSDRVFLKVPSGSVWTVKLHRDEDGVLLKDGWTKFMKHYNIDSGHSLVFRYEGHLRFLVIILDKTTCEIDYRITPDDPDRAGFVEGLPLGPKMKEPSSELSDDDVVELRSFASGRKRKTVLPSRCHKKLKVPRRRQDGATRVHVSDASTSRSLGLRFERWAKQIDEMNAAEKALGHLNADCIKYSPTVETAERSGALSRASSFKCKGPSLLVVVQPSLVHPYFQLRLTKKFTNLYASKIGLSGELRLMASGNRIWKVAYVNNVICSFRRGWKEFAVDNDLKVGDVCVFELLLGRSEVTFRVVIFRSDIFLS